MNQKPLLIGCGVVLFLFAGNAATQEYSQIKSRLQQTQAKVDALTDELKATTKTIHAAIKSLTERFAKQLESTSIERTDSGPIEQTELQPRIVMHSADEEKGFVCGPCRAWLKTEKAKWEKVGWSIEVVKEVETKRGWPWYEITDRDGDFQVDGPLTTDKFLAAKKAR